MESIFTHNSHRQAPSEVTKPLGLRFDLTVHSLLLSWRGCHKFLLKRWTKIAKVFQFSGMMLCAVCNLTSLYPILVRMKQKSTFIWNEKYGEYFFAMILNFCKFLLFLSFGFWSITRNRILFVIGALHWFSRKGYKNEFIRIFLKKKRRIVNQRIMTVAKFPFSVSFW